MTVIDQMWSSHPQVDEGDTSELVRRCLEACVECAQVCTVCADACLGEEMVADLVG